MSGSGRGEVYLWGWIVLLIFPIMAPRRGKGRRLFIKATIGRPQKSLYTGFLHERSRGRNRGAEEA